MIFDALIIGGGPAGLSTALALARVCRKVLLFDSGTYRNAGVTAMHTVLSRDGTNPSEFRSIALSQLEKYPSIKFQKTSVVEVSRAEVGEGYMGFEATDNEDNAFVGKKLVLATGTEDILPLNIPGYMDNWPSHIYQCLFCDGYEQRNHPIGVLTFTNPSYKHLVLMALNFNVNTTIYSNGLTPSDTSTQQALETVLVRGAKLDSRPVRYLINNGPGPQNGITIVFNDGTDVKVGMLLHKPTTRNRAQHLVDHLGLKVKPDTGEISTDPLFCETSVYGCFSAGDTQDVVKQVAIAMGAGVRAGAAVSMQLCNEEAERP